MKAHKTTALNFILKWIIFSMLLLHFSGCINKKSEQANTKIDSAIYLHDTVKVTHLKFRSIDSVRNQIKNDDIIRLSQFYKVKNDYYVFLRSKNAKDSLLLYADSNLLLFKGKELDPKYTKLYFNALVAKGDALYILEKYTQAVFYFLEARSYRKKNLDICYDETLNMRLANVYFVQGKYIEAANSYKRGYVLGEKCKKNENNLAYFYHTQAALNNTGYSYEKANLLDSAKHYYLKNIAFLAQMKANKRVRAYSIQDAEAIALDNLGSIFLKQGNLMQAEQYLKKSINTYYTGGEGAKVPPLIKLAHLYTIKSNFTAAKNAFLKAKLLLEKIPDSDLESRYNKEISDFYFRQDKFELAYIYQKKYISHRDSSIVNNSKISSINIEKDFASLQQKYHLEDLERRNSVKNVYLIFAALLLIFVLIITLLLIKGIKQSKKNHLITKLHNAELQESLLKLEDANRNYARVMKIMAHDLRNPLNGISGVSELLLTNKEITKLGGDSLAIIKTSADHAMKMINEILDAVLHTNDEQNFEKENFDIRILLYQCVSLLNFKAAEKKQKLIIKPAKNQDLVINANKEKLWRVFNNIIVNAIKFSPDDSTIELGFKNTKNSTIIYVADRGIGIPEEFKNKVFDMFTEAKRIGTSGEKPYGLGLSISKQIIEAHQGQLWFEPNPAGGTIFYIELPN